MLKTNFAVARIGNTVPYPPVSDNIRRNHGYLDLRGRPDLVVRIPEAADSRALYALLVYLAQPRSQIFTVGCDLGVRRKRHKPTRVAGGYIQIIRADYLNASGPDYFAWAEAVVNALKGTPQDREWEVEFVLQSVVFRVDGDHSDPVSSVLIWFHARAHTHQEAAASREELIRALHDAIAATQPKS